MPRMLKPTMIAILATSAFAIASGTLQQQLSANASTTFLANKTNKSLSANKLKLTCREECNLPVGIVESI